MARYDVVRGWFRTPNGVQCLIYYRTECNDFNTARSCLDEDEYGLRGRPIAGLALDVGGYLGCVSIAVLLDNPTATATCVEPVPENADLIERNARVNGVADRLELVRGAVGRSGVPVTVTYAFEGGENELHHAFVGNSTIVTPDTLPHRAVTYVGLDLLDLLGDRECEWMKLDTEGGEWDLLAGPGAGRVAHMTGEWHNTPRPGGGTGSRELLSQLLSPTHDLAFTGPEGGPGGFTAVRR